MTEDSATPNLEEVSATALPPKTEPEKKPSARQKAMATVRKCHEATSIIDGKVIGWNRGGFHVSLGGIAAFCPRSQMELGNPRNPASYLDQELTFKVLEIDDKGQRIVVSRKDLLADERAAKREELEIGAVLKGRVDSLSDFGAFVDLGGGLRGLVHLSEMSQKRIERPEEVVSVGREVEVKVLKVEKGGDRISLSLSALEPDPWIGLEDQFARGSSFEGTIVRQTDFGLFVDVGDGIEGLVHSSQLPIGGSLSDSSLGAGQPLSGWVREIDCERHRLSLTLREVPEGDPWEGVAKRYDEGQLVEGQVEQVSRFGFFVSLEPGLTGLLPFSAVSAPSGRKRENAYRLGQQISVTVLELNPKRRRISLGLEGAQAEASRADRQNFLQKQGAGSGLGAIAAAFEKMKQQS